MGRFVGSRAFIAGHLFVALMLGPSSSASAKGRVATVHRQDAPGFQKWTNSLAKAGLRPTVVSVVVEGGAPLFAGVAVPGASPWELKIGESSEDFERTSRELRARGYRPLSICGYEEKGRLLFASAWVKDGSTRVREARHALEPPELIAYVSGFPARHMKPEFIAIYGVGASRKAALIAADEGSEKDWDLRSDLTEEDLRKRIDEQGGNGFWPRCVSAYREGAHTRFAVVFDKRTPSPAWAARTGLSTADFEVELERQAAAGMVPTSLSAYHQGKDLRYAVVWSREYPDTLPGSGKVVADLAAFDEAMRTFMRDHAIPCGALAIARDGRLIFARGYGYIDGAATEVVAPDAPFRIASVTKAFTNAAIRRLIRERKLRPDVRVFPLLGVEPPPGKTPDPRLARITVQHLLDHKGGWDRESVEVNPMLASLKIAQSLGRPCPPTIDDIIRYMVGEPLDFDPGSHPPGRDGAYSNFGYCVLGRVIEKVSGRSYGDYLNEFIIKPISAQSIALGRSLPKDRNPAEPFYSDPFTAPSVFPPLGAMVPSPDGSFCLEVMDAHGGLVASAPDVIKFLKNYWITGERRLPGIIHGYRHSGSLYGSFALAEQRDGVDFVVLFNQLRGPAPGAVWRDRAGDERPDRQDTALADRHRLSSMILPPGACFTWRAEVRGPGRAQ